MRVLLVASRLEVDFDADDVARSAVRGIESVLPHARVQVAHVTASSLVPSTRSSFRMSGVHADHPRQLGTNFGWGALDDGASEEGRSSSAGRGSSSASLAGSLGSDLGDDLPAWTLVLVVHGGEVLDASERAALTALAEDPTLNVITLLGPHFTPDLARTDPWPALAIPSGPTALGIRVALITELALRWWTLRATLTTRAHSTP